MHFGDSDLFLVCPGPKSSNTFKAKTPEVHFGMITPHTVHSSVQQTTGKNKQNRRWALGPAGQPVRAKTKVKLKVVNMAEVLTPSI